MSYEKQCVAAVQAPSGEVRRCEREAAAHDPLYLALIPVCSWHAERARRQFAAPLHEELQELRREVAGHECDSGRAVMAYMTTQVDQHLRGAERMRKRSRAYFIRCGEYIKIGASSSPMHRLLTIRNIGGVLSPRGLDLSNSSLIATEPGGFNRERELHAKFAHLRHTGEWFTEAPELTDYIRNIERSAA